MSTTDPVIRIEGLTKTFGEVRALDGLDLEVAPGEVHGFLGPNGAGKSTTIRIVLGLMRATGGHVELFGGDPWRDAARLHARLAYVAGDVALWRGLTGGQCLDVLGATQGRLGRGPAGGAHRAVRPRPDQAGARLLQGQPPEGRPHRRARRDADLLVLDEPTSGLDPLMEQAFQEVVRERRDEGCTVLLSSHILGEVEALADRVSIIRRGRTVTTGTLADLRRHTRTHVHAITVDAPAGLADAPGVDELATGRVDGHVDTRFTIDAEHLDDVVGRLHEAQIHTLTVTPPSLDALFLRTYDGEAAPLDATGLDEPEEARR